MAIPMPEQEELYKRMNAENIAIKKNVWDFIYHRVNDNTTAVITICQPWLENKEPMPVKEAEKIVACTNDIKNALYSITAPSKENSLFPQFKNEIPLNALVKGLITHQFGNDIFAIELMLHRACNPKSAAPVPSAIVQKIALHAQAMKSFLERFRNTVQWKESEEKYRHLYDSFQDGLLMTDIKGRILEVNQASLDMLDYSKDEITKLTYQQLTPEKWRKNEEEFIKSLVSAKDNSSEYEKEIMKKDGTIVPIHIRIWLIKDKEGAPLGTWGVIQDISAYKRTEREFEEEVLASHVLIDTVGIGLSLSDKNGRFAIFNAHMQKITGYTMEEINSHGLAALLYPDPEDRERAISRLAEVAAGGGTNDVETMIKTKDGSKRTLSVSTSLIAYKGSDMFLSIWRDITEGKRMQDALQTSEIRFRRLFETAQDGILILDAGTGQIREVNKFLIDMLGYSREEFLGKKLWEIGAFIDIDKSKTAFKELQAKGYVRYDDLPLKGQSGRIMNVEFVSNVYEVDREKVIQCNIRDITERMFLQKALEDSETRFRRLFETAQDGILILDTEVGRVNEVNKFLIDMLGYSREEFIGKKLWELGAFIDIDKSKAAFKELQAKGYVRYEDLPLKTKDGRLINVEFVSNVYKVDRAKVIQCNIRDITDRRRLEVEREGWNKKLEQLALKDSHTGLYNHRYLREALQIIFSRTERRFGFFSVIMMDLDYFKSINDVYGHIFGDLVLKQFATLLTKTVRPYDIAIRYGGEEFIIISPDTGRGGALILANRILDNVNAKNFGDKKHSVKVKLSIAVATYPEDNVRTGMELVELADKVLRKVKESGGNRVASSADRKIVSEAGAGSSAIHVLTEKIVRLTKRANQGLIEEMWAFAKTLGLKDHYTSEHVEKTVQYAMKMARELHVSADQIESIKQAAMLHDVGKIGVHDKILHKKSKLNTKEFEEIKRHPQMGADIIKAIHALYPAIPFVLYHHERWDGKGYPQGLAGERIPLGARIVAVADVHQALVSDRPYRKAYSKKKARAIVRKASGTQFDPEVVNSFLRVLADEA